MVTYKLEIGLQMKIPFIEPQKWRQLYKTAVKKNNGKCNFCGIECKKINITLVRNSTDVNEKTSLICCKICKMIYECHYTYEKELILCYSKLQQNEIVIRSINYIKNNNCIPMITNIDPDAMRLNLSLIEYLDVIGQKNKLPKEMDNYKLFLTPYFDKSHIVDVQIESESMFVDDNDSEPDEFESDDKYEKYELDTNVDKELPLYNFTDNEKNILDKLFKPNTINMLEMNKIIHDAIKMQFYDEIKYSDVAEEHYKLFKL